MPLPAKSFADQLESEFAFARKRPAGAASHHGPAHIGRGCAGRQSAATSRHAPSPARSRALQAASVAHVKAMDWLKGCSISSPMETAWSASFAALSAYPVNPAALAQVPQAQTPGSWPP